MTNQLTFRPLEFDKGQVFTPKFLADWVAQILTENMSSVGSSVILDPACGDGELLAAVKEILPKASLYGVDIDPLAIKEAQEKVSGRGKFFLADMLTVEDIKSRETVHLPKKIDAIIANPPWGADTRSSRSQLKSAGFKLAYGQYDTWCLFVELSLKRLKNNGRAVFILPDAIFLPEHEQTRRFIAEDNTIELLARLGEGLFRGVCRGTVVILLEKVRAKDDHKVEVLRLSRNERKKITEGKLTLAKARHSLSHLIPQNHFISDRLCRWEIDVQNGERKTIEKIEKFGSDWSSFLEIGRGVEISKKGAVRCCPKCTFVIPAPTKPREVICRRCGSVSYSEYMPLRHVISSEPLNGDFIPFIAGEDVKRYALKPKRYIELNVDGLNYKDIDVYSKERLLVRKTGIGLNATITSKKAASNQVVFHFVPKDSIARWSFYLPYVLGVMSSRIMFAYHLKKSGESEWRSHPYVTPKVLKTLPIPVPREGTQAWAQAHAIADAVSSHLEYDEKREEYDLRIECLVAGLFGFSTEDIVWTKRVISSAQNLQPMRALQNFDEISVFADRVN